MTRYVSVSFSGERDSGRTELLSILTKGAEEAGWRCRFGVVGPTQETLYLVKEDEPSVPGPDGFTPPPGQVA